MSSKITMVADSTQADESNGKKKQRKKKKVSDKKGKKSKKGNIRKKYAKNPEDSESESDLDLSKELKPIGQYVKDRDAMLQEMFRSIGLKKLKTMLPDILKPLPIEELHKLCVDQVEAMSKKRIRQILDGHDPANISSSGTEEESSNDEEPKPDLQSQVADSTSQPGIDGSASHHSPGSCSPSSRDHSPHSSKVWSDDSQSESECQEATPGETQGEKAAEGTQDGSKQFEVGGVKIKQEKVDEPDIKIKEEPVSEESEVEPEKPWRKPEDDNIAPSEDTSQSESESLVSESGSEEGEVRYRKKNDSQEEDSAVEKQNEEDHNKKLDKNVEEKAGNNDVGKGKTVETKVSTTEPEESHVDAQTEDAGMGADTENADSPQVIVIVPIGDKDRECHDKVETETQSDVTTGKYNEGKVTTEIGSTETSLASLEKEGNTQVLNDRNKAGDDTTDELKDDAASDKTENIPVQINEEQLNEKDDNVSIENMTPPTYKGTEDESDGTVKGVDERLDIQVQVDDDRVSDLSDDTRSLPASPMPPSAEKVNSDSEQHQAKTVEEQKIENEIKKPLRPRILPPSPDKTHRLKRVSSFSKEQDSFIIHVSTDEGNSESDSETNDGIRESIGKKERFKRKVHDVISVSKSNVSRASVDEETKEKSKHSGVERQISEARKYVNSGKLSSADPEATEASEDKTALVVDKTCEEKCEDNTLTERKTEQASKAENLMLKKESDLRQAITSRLKAAEAKNKEKEEKREEEDTRKIYVAGDVPEKNEMAGVGISGRRIILKKPSVKGNESRSAKTDGRSSQKEKDKSSETSVKKRSSTEDTKDKGKKVRVQSSGGIQDRSKSEVKTTEKSTGERRVIRVKEEIRTERQMMKASSSSTVSRTYSKPPDRHSRYTEGQSSRMYSDNERKHSDGTSSFTRRGSYREQQKSPGRRDTSPKRASASTRSRSPPGRGRDSASHRNTPASSRGEKRPSLSKSLSDSKIPKLEEKYDTRHQERRASASGGKGDFEAIKKTTERRQTESGKHEGQNKSAKTHSKSRQVISTETAEPEIKKVLVTTADGRKFIKTIKTTRVIKRMASSSKSQEKLRKSNPEKIEASTSSTREIAEALKATHQLPKVSTLKADDPVLEKEIMDEMEILELEMRARAIKAMLEKQEAKDKKDGTKKGSKTKKSSKK